MNKNISSEKNLKNVTGGVELNFKVTYDSEEIDNSKTLVNQNGGNEINFFEEKPNIQKDKMDTLIKNFKTDGTMTTKKQ